MTEASIIQRDLQDFFAFISAPQRTPATLARAYVAFHGNLHWGHQELFFTTLREAMGKRPDEMQRTDVLGPHGEIRPELLASIDPTLEQPYFTAAAASDIETLPVLPESRNEWQDTALPPGISKRIGLAVRPAFAILRAAVPQLYASPYGFQAFDAAEGVFWPELSTRAFSRSVETYPRESLEQPLVVVMDQFDGGNFCHFLCDTVSRALHFQQHLPDEAARSVFLLGGAPGRLQRLVVRLICEATGLDERQFRFMDRRAVIETRQKMYFFSDQGQRNMHPLQMAHPASVRLVRDLFARLVPSEPLSDRIYISRGDADLRRITNEEALIAALHRHGYQTVRLAEHDILRQWSIVCGARAIVAPHGMGLTWLLFHRGMAGLLELFHPSNGSDAYVFMAKALGLSHDFLVGTDAQDQRVGYAIDVDAVMSRLPR